MNVLLCKPIINIERNITQRGLQGLDQVLLYRVIKGLNIFPFAKGYNGGQMVCTLDVLVNAHILVPTVSTVIS